MKLTVLSFLLLAVVSSFTGQQSEVSRDVRSKLFKQVLADYPDVRECIATRREALAQPRKT